MKRLAAPILAVALSILPLWRGSSAAGEDDKTVPAVPVKTLATVNGVPITDYDVQESLKRVPHGEKPPDAANPTILQTLVRDELICQKAVELGLDADPAYRKKVGEAQAQLRAFQRETLRNLYREHVRAEVSVTDSEARAYFDNNANRIRTKIHVLQITGKGEPAQMARAEEDLKKGTPFPEVASRRLPNLPKDGKAPWDIGLLHWSQIPEPWKNVVYGMEAGQTSGIIEGPGGRSWIIQVTEKNLDAAVTFETEKARIVAVLQKQKMDEAYEGQLRQLKEHAKIVFPQ